MVEKDERHLGHTLIPHAYADKKGAQTSQTGRQREGERQREKQKGAWSKKKLPTTKEQKSAWQKKVMAK